MKHREIIEKYIMPIISIIPLTGAPKSFIYVVIKDGFVMDFTSV